MFRYISDNLKTKDWEERLRSSREKQQEELKRKMNDLREAFVRAEEFRKKQEEEKKKKMEDMRKKEEKHRAVVEERRKRRLEEENVNTIFLG